MFDDGGTLDSGRIEELVAYVPRIENMDGQGKVYYTGGSSFVLEFPGEKRTRLDIGQFDGLVSASQVRVIDQRRIDEIKASILPDGSTSTHKADGTPKTPFERTKEMLLNDGELAYTATGQLTIGDPEDAKGQPGPSEARPQQSGDMAHQTDGLDDMFSSPEPSRRGDPEADLSDLLSDDKPGADVTEPAQATGHGDMPRRQRDIDVTRSRRDADMPSDDSYDGTGYGDDNDDYDDDDDDEKRKRHSVPVMTVLVSLACAGICVGLFFGTHAVVSAATESIGLGTGYGYSPEKAEREAKIEESGRDKVERDDFDPESAVVEFDLATDAEKQIAIDFFQAVRQSITDKSWDEYSQIVAIDSVGDQLADAYAQSEGARQGLTAEQRSTLKAAWKDTFVAQEKRHVEDGDVYAEIFSGRIREVRRSSDGNTLYVVLESIGGDHQRICAIMSYYEDADAWIVNGVTDAKGYIDMILEGPRNPTKEFVAHSPDGD